MAAVSSKSPVKLPIPEDITKFHHQPESIWKSSPGLDKRVKASPTTKGFKACVVDQRDPEWSFVMRLFNANKPPGVGVRKITRICNAVHVQMFEAGLLNMEREAEDFPPSWQNEEPKTLRRKAIRRFEQLVQRFPPVCVKTEEGTTQLKRVFALPLLHGSRHWEAIASHGFARFGKHHFFDAKAPAGSQQSTDIGFYGDGYYFTDSAAYAHLYDPNLILTIVSGRWPPYPVVNDKPFPQEGTDMLNLMGKGLVQNYNTHFVPSASIDPEDPQCMVYHPTDDIQEPTCDEFVVAQQYQALPYVHIETGVDFPKAPSADVPTRVILYNKLLTLIDRPLVSSDHALYSLFSNKIGDLSFDLNQKPSPQDAEFDHWVSALFKPDGQIDANSKQKLLESQGVKVYKEEKKAPPPSKKTTKVKESKTKESSPLGSALDSRGDWNEKDKPTLLQVAEANPERVDRSKKNGLHVAAEYGKPASLAKILTTHKHLLESRDIMGRTPLLVAVVSSKMFHQGAIDKCEILLNAKADINAVNDDGETALHRASGRAVLEVVSLLLERGDKNLIKRVAKNGNTPLHSAAGAGKACTERVATCEFLLKAGVDANARNRDGLTALQIAQKKGDVVLERELTKLTDSGCVIM